MPKATSHLADSCLSLNFKKTETWKLGIRGLSHQHICNPSHASCLFCPFMFHSSALHSACQSSFPCFAVFFPPLAWLHPHLSNISRLVSTFTRIPAAVEYVHSFFLLTLLKLRGVSDTHCLAIP